MKAAFVAVCMGCAALAWGPKPLVCAELDPPASSAAATRFAAAEAAFVAGRHSEAAEAFEQTHRLYPSGSTIYNAARAWDEVPDPSLAARAYAEALALGGLSEAQHKHARSRLEHLSVRLAKVGFDGPEELRVLDARKREHAVPVTLFFDPSTPRIHYINEHGEPRSVWLPLTPGTSLAHRFAEAEAQGKPPLSQPSEDVAAPSTKEPVAGPHAVGWAGITLALGGAVAASALGYLFLSKRSDFIETGKTNRGLRDDAVLIGHLTTASLGVTLVGVGLAAWDFTRSSNPDASRVAFRIMPLACQIEGRF